MLDEGSNLSRATITCVREYFPQFFGSCMLLWRFTSPRPATLEAHLYYSNQQNPLFLSLWLFVPKMVKNGLSLFLPIYAWYGLL
jgi:hypothetical protein